MHAFIDGSESYRSGREQVSLNLPWLVIIYVYTIIYAYAYIILFLYMSPKSVPASRRKLPFHPWVSDDFHGFMRFGNLHTFEYEHAHRGALAQECGKLVRHQEPLSNAGFTKTSPGLLFVLCLAMAQGTASPWGGLHVIVRNCRNIMKD